MKTIHELILPEEAGYVLNPARSYFALVMPEDSVNLVTNPECADLYTYSGVSATVAISAATQRRGGSAILVTPSAANGGIVCQLAADLTSGKTYTFSVDVKGPGRIVLAFANSAGAALAQTVTVDTPRFWCRQQLTVRVPAGARTVTVRSPDTAPFFVDGFQVEEKPYATTFISGNLETARDTMDAGRASYGWLGPTHRSASFRTKFVRTGGRPVTLDELGFEVTDFSGFGYMAPELLSTQLAFARRSIFQGVRQIERQFTIGGVLRGDSVLQVLAKRGALGGYVWGGQGGVAPVVLQVQFYDETLPVSELVEIECVYLGGLEGVVTSLYQEKVVLNFRAWRPNMRTEGNRGAQLLMLGSVPVGAGTFVRVVNADDTTDVLTDVGVITDAEYLPYRMAVDASGVLYVCNGSRLSRYFLGAWSTVYTSPNGHVKDVVAAPNGFLYFIVEDEDDGGHTGRCLRYDTASGLVSNPSANPSTNEVLFQTGNPDGSILELTRIRYNPANNSIYVCGNFGFMTVGGVAVTGWDTAIARCPLSNHAWTALPDLVHYALEQTHSTIYDVAWDKQGRTWVGGKIRRKNLDGTPTATNNGLYRLNGSTWEAPTTAMPVQGDKGYVSPEIYGYVLRSPSDAASVTVDLIGSVPLSGFYQFEVGSTLTVNGQKRKVTSIVNEFRFTVDVAINLWNGSQGYQGWSYTSGDSVTCFDCGIRVLCFDPAGDWLYVGGQVDSVVRYDGAYKTARYLNSRGVARLSTKAGSYYSAVDGGLAEMVFTSPPETKQPWVEDLVLNSDSQSIWVAGAFRGFFHAGVAQEVVSPGVALISVADGLLNKPREPISAPRYGPPNAPSGYAGAVVRAPERSGLGTNAYTPVDAQPYAQWYGDLPGGVFNYTDHTIFISFSPNHATTLRETPVTAVTIPPGVTAVPRLEVKGPCTLRRIINVTTGREIDPELAIAAGEVVIFSFAPGPVWIRSTTKGDITYEMYGQDSFPDLGLVAGVNQIIMDVAYQSGCEAWLYWNEEYAAVDDLVARNQA